MKKAFSIFLNALPVLLMVAFIPVIGNDYLLSLVYLVVIMVALLVRKEKNDLLIFVFGFCIMTFFEYVFVSTGVEIFRKRSLFGMMPIWLPFLWGYGFIAIKRGVGILNK